MILHVYIARRFLCAFLIVLGIFVSILLPIDMAEQMRRIGNSNADLVTAFELAMLNLPGTLYEMLPLFVMLATLFLFLGLARTAELAVIRAAGRSVLRSILSPVVVAILLGLLGVFVINPIIAATERQYARVIARHQTGEDQTLSISAHGFWLRQGSESRQTVIRADQLNADGTVLRGASFFTFNESGVMERRIEAGIARLTSGSWALANVKIWPIADVSNPEAEAEFLENYSLPSSLTHERIRDTFSSPTKIPIYELPDFIQYLNQAGIAALPHRVWMQMEFSSPLMLAAMVLIGAGFTTRHARFGKTGVMVLSALLLGFGVFFIRGFAQTLGENGQLPILAAAWIPPAAAILLALCLLLHTEDG
ncbi:MAG: LPS export ABC transporter permease LptG [Rhodobacteraceae bacterium]|nr:LPS export ABC transporter permease LptG [Paracoccaceae bacterium]